MQRQEVSTEHGGWNRKGLWKNQGASEAGRWETGLRCSAGECGLCPKVNKEGPLKDHTHGNVIVGLLN